MILAYLALLFAKLKTALSWLLGAFKAYPWQAALILALALALWLYSGKHNALEKLAAEKQAHANDIAAWNAKAKAAQAATAKAEQDAKESADDAQEYHEKLAAANDGLERYIADHRVRPVASARSTASAAQGNAPAVSDSATPSTLVALDESDVRACDGAYVYAAAAFQWGQSLIAKGLAVEGK